MGLLNLSVQDAVNDISQKLLNPFKRDITPEEVRSAHARNDFKEGLRIAELLGGTFNEFRPDTIRLKGDTMPHIPFGFGGTQKLVKDYYPGNSEPTVQVLGPREKDIILRGRLKSKKIKVPTPPVSPLEAAGNFAAGFASKRPPVSDIPGVSNPRGKSKTEEYRTYAQEMQQLMDGMRLRGNLIRITMGEFQRFGFIEETSFKLRTVADIDYEIKLSIVGLNPPSDCRILAGAKTIPTAANKVLITVTEVFKEFRPPSTMPRGIAEQINDAISNVGEAVSLVTGFVDTALNEVDDIKAAVSRALGLVKNARNQITSFQRRVGAIDTFGGSGVDIASGGGIASGYSNASFLSDTLSSSFSINGLLENLRAQIANIALSEPVARHLVRDGDTLQKIAIKFYQDSEQWKEIYDHNKLTTTALTRGAILEIPRL